MSNVSYKTGVTGAGTFSSTLATLGEGLDMGHIRLENGSFFQLVKSAAACPDGEALAIDLSDTLADVGLSVRPVAADQGGVAGFNNVGAATADGDFFWMLAMGNGYGRAITGHSIVAGDILSVAATTGLLDEIALATTDARIAIARATPGTGPINFNIYFEGCFGQQLTIISALATIVNGQNYGALA